MGNGMYCEAEVYMNDVSDEERLYTESRRMLSNLKSGHRRLVVMMKQLKHFKNNPLGGAMAKQVETQIYQQSLILKRQHESLNSMVEEFNRQNEDTDSTQSSSQHSSQSDWEEVIEMAKMPIDYVLSRSHATGSSNGDEVFKSLYYSSPSCSTAMTPGQNMNSFRRKSPRKAFPQQMTPPIEEVIEFREKLREIEKSPLFSATPLTKRTQIAEMLADTQPTPLSMP